VVLFKKFVEKMRGYFGRLWRFCGEKKWLFWLFVVFLKNDKNSL
jgi:hypothetical protein